MNQLLYDTGLKVVTHEIVSTDYLTESSSVELSFA